MMTNILKVASLAGVLALSALPFSALAAGTYASSNLGYDLSYGTYSYPIERFSFGIVGVTNGKAFTHNARITSEYAWARNFSSAAAPTVYMNLNAPYGSSVAGNVTSPKVCPPSTVISTTTSSMSGMPAGTTEPTACQGYDYGYNAAKDAFAYAKLQGATAPLWWLDIEDANSWSDTTAVNDATIQGAIDYLNAQGVRVGIYSVPYMWREIAGTTFVPTQTIASKAVSIPLWLPIGTTNLVGAANSCVTQTGFIAGSPIWLVQYEANSTAIDQNYAC